MKLSCNQTSKFQMSTERHACGEERRVRASGVSGGNTVQNLASCPHVSRDGPEVIRKSDTARTFARPLDSTQGCQMAKFDPCLSLDCARVEGVGGTIQGKTGIKFCSVA